MNFAGRFLIRTAGAAPFGMGMVSRPEFPLFASSAFTFGAAPVTAAEATAAAAMSEWQVAPLKTAVGEGQNGWDLAHELLAAGRDVSGSPVTFVEPDFAVPFPFTRTAAAGVVFAAAQAGDVCMQDPPDADWPQGAGFAWHLGPAHTQLQAAREQAGLPAPGTPKVRIAHLDTGYSPAHQGLPEFLRVDMARNFVETDTPLSAVDPGASGFLKNPGHGTGTLGILAGARVQQPGFGFDGFLGGAPHAEVVPVRIGDSVVHFYSSSMAQGLDYALAAGCQVVTISMGGVPSKAWAEVVNRLYEAGVAVFAAAGNNFGGVPTTSTVYPARFNRVTAVCGAAADRTPYFKGVLTQGMQGNFGPEAKMSTAIAAYTPNIPWAQWGCPGIVDLDGAGTSSATPQAAAAAALWLQHHAAALQAPEFQAAPWKKVEALRRALFTSADKTAPESAKFFGQGLLRAQAALAVAPTTAGLVKAPEDSVSWPWIRLLFGVGAAGPDAVQEMLEVEMVQLLSAHGELAGPEAELMHEDAIPSPEEGRRIVKRLIDSPQTSKVLRARLQTLGL